MGFSDLLHWCVRGGLGYLLVPTRTNPLTSRTTPTVLLRPAIAFVVTQAGVYLFFFSKVGHKTYYQSKDAFLLVGSHCHSSLWVGEHNSVRNLISMDPRLILQ